MRKSVPLEVQATEADTVRVRHILSLKNNIPQEQQVVSYWRKNGRLILIKCLSEACPGTVCLSK